MPLTQKLVQIITLSTLIFGSFNNKVFSVNVAQEKKVNTSFELAQTQNTTIQDSYRYREIRKRLVEKRIVTIFVPIDDNLAQEITTQLLYLDKEKPGKDIYLCINSPGGSVISGMAIYDTMKSLKSDVVTINMGTSFSMAALLLAGGTKGKRFSLPNSRIMIHQPSSSTQGQAIDTEILYHKANLNKLLAHNTGQPLEKIANDTKQDFFMSPQQAKAYGMIDKVINKTELANFFGS